MTHYDIDYAGMGPYDARQKALKDARDWLGEERWAVLSRDFPKLSGVAFPQFRLMMAFAGIQGFPVVALYREWIDGSLTDAQAAE